MQEPVGLSINLKIVLVFHDRGHLVKAARVGVGVEVWGARVASKEQQNKS